MSTMGFSLRSPERQRSRCGGRGGKSFSHLAQPAVSACWRAQNRQGLQKQLHIFAGNVDYRIAFGGVGRTAQPTRISASQTNPSVLLAFCQRGCQTRLRDWPDDRKAFAGFDFAARAPSGRLTGRKREFRRPVMVGMRTIFWLRRARLRDGGTPTAATTRYRVCGSVNGSSIVGRQEGGPNPRQGASIGHLR